MRGGCDAARKGAKMKRDAANSEEDRAGSRVTQLLNEPYLLCKDPFIKRCSSIHSKIARGIMRGMAIGLKTACSAKFGSRMLKIATKKRDIDF